MVWLSARNIRTIRPSKKRDFKSLEPFCITAAIGLQAYRLKLPESMKAIYNVFYVSLLESVKCRKGEAILQPKPVEADGEEE